VFTLPYFFAYVFFFGYEFRSFAPAMAPVGILCGIGLNFIINNLNKKFQEKKILFFYKSTLFFSVIIIIILMNGIRNFEKLKDLNLQALKKRGDYELNILLYNFLNKNDKIKVVYVMRDYNSLYLLPEINYKFIDTQCEYYEKNYEKSVNKSYYILTDSRELINNNCKNLFNRIEKLSKEKRIKKIFEYKNYKMYLKE